MKKFVAMIVLAGGIALGSSISSKQAEANSHPAFAWCMVTHLHYFIQHDFTGNEAIYYCSF